MFFNSYRDYIKKIVSQNLGADAFSSLEERQISSIEKDAERIVGKTGVSKEDAVALAAVNFRRDLKVHMGILPPKYDEYMYEEELDEIDIKILKNLSEKALEPFSNEMKRRIRLT